MKIYKNIKELEADIKDNVLVVDTTNGYVGIGTVPSFPLHVVSSTFNSIDRYNSNSANLSLSPSIRLRGAMGTVSTPTKTLLGSWIGKNDYAGYTGSAFTGLAASLVAFAEEDFTSTAQGAGFSFWTTPIGGIAGNVTAERMRITGSGAVSIGIPFPTADAIFTANGTRSYFIDTATVGAEKIGNPNFTTVPDTAWTWGTGWAHDTTNKEADHTAGNTADLTNSTPVSAPVIGELYKVYFEIKNWTVGNITPSVGGVTLRKVQPLVNAGIYRVFTFIVQATNTTNLAFTPSIDFDGSIDNVSLKLITGGGIYTNNIITDITTGLKIGTATSQKLGFFNATPVVQQIGCAVPTDLTTCITAITALRTALNNLGLTTVV